MRTHTLIIPGQQSRAVMKWEICPKPSGALLFDEILSLCVHPNTMFMELKVVYVSVYTAHHIHINTHLQAVLLYARLFTVYVFTLLHRTQLHVGKKKKTEKE